MPTIAPIRHAYIAPQKEDILQSIQHYYVGLNQNNKLVQYGVTYMMVIDGYSCNIVGVSIKL